MPVKTRLVDLSLEGCRVRTYGQFTGKAGWPVEIAFKVKGFAFRFGGIVRWNDDRHLLGIQFVNMMPRRKSELAAVIEQMAAAVAARAKAVGQLIAEQWAPAPALPDIPELLAAKPVEPEAVKANEPLLVTKAIELPVETLAPAKTHTEEAEIPAEIQPPVRRAAKPRDRRGQSRYDVDTIATLFLVNAGSALRGHILDLSVSGCRIRTDERFPVGIYRRVETEFRLQGLSFRLGGVTQSIHNCYTVGIRFLDLSERKRQQVLELIDEMEQMRAATTQADAAPTEEPHEADGH
jgi:c-di-GMP-binding flagellar brake protein YcgR